MNGHTDYRSELVLTKELVSQYDSNLQRIIKEFGNYGISIKCYEDIKPYVTTTGYKYASGSNLKINSSAELSKLPISFQPYMFVAEFYVYLRQSDDKSYPDGTGVSSYQKGAEGIVIYTGGGLQNASCMKGFFARQWGSSDSSFAVNIDLNSNSTFFYNHRDGGGTKASGVSIEEIFETSKNKNVKGELYYSKWMAVGV